MLKPMGKKHRLDEWRGAPAACGPKLPTHLNPLLAPNKIALRLQLRYQKYQEKARMLLKKTNTSQQHHEPASGRFVATSSIALAVAVQPRIVSKFTSASMHRQCDYVDKWSTEMDWTRLQVEEFDTISDIDSDAIATHQHIFVNVMESSWLLSSIEQRCAENTTSTYKTPRTKRSRPSLVRQFIDVKLAVLDLLFISRSGVSVNLYGNTPSSVKTHYTNLLTRVKTLNSHELNQVTCIFESLKSDMVMPAVRCLGWLLTKTWRLLFDGLHVDIASLQHVWHVYKATKGHVSVVFAPTHKSHLDYLIISYLCFAYGIPLPRIAAGNNLDLPLVGSFLRANGSFFIRRSFRSDPLYKHVLEHYVHELLDDGNPVEVFIEGGRSRHGRVGKPRLGFLSMFLSFVKGSSNDQMENEKKDKKTVLIVPISLDYDKVYEVDGYANQLLGKPKTKESLAVLCRSVYDLFFLRLGHTYVRFGEPVALTETSMLDDSSDLVAERMQGSGTITSTSMVSALLMWKRAYVTKGMIETRTRWLRNELKKRGATVAPMKGNEIATHAMDMLKIEIKSNGIINSFLQYPVRALEVGFYRNHLLYLFLPEMAVIGALDGVLRLKGNERYVMLKTIEISKVKEQARKIWCFLRHICRHRKIDIDEYVNTFLAQRAECDTDNLLHTVTVHVKQWQSAKVVSFVLSLHWSFMDTLWLTTQGLWSLFDSKDKRRSQHEVVRQVQNLAKELVLRQQLFHTESLCSESMIQSLDFLIESEVLQQEPSKDGKSRVLHILIDECGLENLTLEVNARRKPHTFLWRQDDLPMNLTRKEAVNLMQKAHDSCSFYAKWMAPPATA